MRLQKRLFVSKINEGNDSQKFGIKSFSVTEYFDHIERTYINILEKQKPVDQTITLWWGLDGFRLNEDGTTEWISRKKPSEVVFYQPHQSIRPKKGLCAIPHDIFSEMCNVSGIITAVESQEQSTRAQIEELMMQNAALQIKATQSMQNAAIIGMLSPHIMPGYMGHSPYTKPLYLQSAFAYPLTQCCCNYGSLTDQRVGENLPQ